MEDHQRLAGAPGADQDDEERFFFAEVALRALALLLARARARAAAARLARDAFARETFTSGLFHPTARSARNDLGMSSGPPRMSVTASAAASARSARTSLITLAGRRARAACTRFVSSTTNMSRSGSIQSDVPVKPVCPYAFALMYLPQPNSPAQVSQPSARVPAARLVNSATVLSATMRVPLKVPPLSSIWAKIAR